MFYLSGRFHSTLYAHLLQQQWEIKMAFFGKKTFQIQGEFVDLKVQKEHYRIPFASWFKICSCHYCEEDFKLSSQYSSMANDK